MNTTKNNYNPIKTVRRLKDAGFSQEQAETWAEVTLSHMSNFATKDDIKDFATKSDIRILEKDIKFLEREIRSVESGLKLEIVTQIKSLETRMLLQITAIMGIFYSLEKFF